MQRHHSYLLVLSRYEKGGRRFVRLPDATVLGWFRRSWRASDEQRAEELGGDVYGLESVFEEIDGPAPSDDAELLKEINRKLYSEQGHDVAAHRIAVETNDDEYPIHYYLFDDDFLAQPDAWDELPDWRAGTALAVIGDSGYEEDGDEDDEEEPAADAFERFYRQRLPDED